MYIFFLYVKCGEKFRGIKTTLNLPLIFSIEEELFDFVIKASIIYT